MIWFTSDLHFDHANIIKYCNRPFRDVHQMNYELVHRWNERVQPDDTVYLLGDFALTSRTRMAELRAALQGQVILIRGNHDRGPNALRECGFDRVESALFTCVDGVNLYLRHVPDDSEDWRPIVTAHLCGHVHEKWKRRGNIINVGVDQWDFRPRSLAELLAAEES